MYAIAAMSANRVIGKDNGLPWPHSKEDFAFFREKTINKPILVGRTTFDSLPPLKGRKPIVLSTKPNPLTEQSMSYVEEGVYNEIRYVNPQYLQDVLHESYEDGREVVCIGGARTYSLVLPYCDTLFLTRWNFEVEGDTYMPDFDNLFPVRFKLRDIEGGKGTIWKYERDIY